MLTAKNILAGTRKYDVWAVNQDAEYHEAGAAGEQAAQVETWVPALVPLPAPTTTTTKTGVAAAGSDLKVPPAIENGKTAR